MTMAPVSFYLKVRQTEKSKKGARTSRRYPGQKFGGHYTDEEFVVAKAKALKEEGFDVKLFFTYNEWREYDL